MRSDTRGALITSAERIVPEVPAVQGVPKNTRPEPSWSTARGQAATTLQLRGKARTHAVRWPVVAQPEECVGKPFNKETHVSSWQCSQSVAHVDRSHGTACQWDQEWDFLGCSVGWRCAGIMMWGGAAQASCHAAQRRGPGHASVRSLCLQCLAAVGVSE